MAVRLPQHGPPKRFRMLRSGVMRCRPRATFILRQVRQRRESDMVTGAQRAAWCRRRGGVYNVNMMLRLRACERRQYVSADAARPNQERECGRGGGVDDERAEPVDRR